MVTGLSRCQESLILQVQPDCMNETVRRKSLKSPVQSKKIFQFTWVHIKLVARARDLKSKIFITNFRSSSRANTRIWASITSTRCHQIQLMTKRITGSYQILQPALKRVGVAYSSGFRSATSVTKASSRKNCAGRMLKIKGLRRFQGHVMMSLVLLIGGSAHGNLVRWHARNLVRKIIDEVKFKSNLNLISPGDMHKPMKKRTILCVDHNEYALPAEHCEDQPQPSDMEPCSLMLPPCGFTDDTLNTPDFSDNEIPDTI